MTLLSYTIGKIINFLDMSEKLLIFSTVPFFERNLKCLKGENVYRFGRIEAVKVVMALQFSTILVLFLKPIVRREKFYAFQNATFVLIFALFFSGTHPPTTSSMRQPRPQPENPCGARPKARP